MPKNELWELFKQAVLSKDELQFNLYSLYSAVESQNDDELNDNQEDINVM